MGRLTGVLTLVLMLAAIGCAEGADNAEMADDADTMTTDMTTDPACEPSERMAVDGRSSPYDSTRLTVGEGVAKVCYGRPSLRGRTMIGGDAVPYGQLWRTGANEPTIIHLSVPASIAGLDVEPGSYSLYTIPQEGEEWTLIVNRSISQWGHESSYTEDVEAQEVGRTSVRAEPMEEEVEQLTFRPMEDGTGLLLEWQNSRVRIPVTAGQ